MLKTLVFIINIWYNDKDKFRKRLWIAWWIVTIANVVLDIASHQIWLVVVSAFVGGLGILTGMVAWFIMKTSEIDPRDVL